MHYTKQPELISKNGKFDEKDRIDIEESEQAIIHNVEFQNDVEKRDLTSEIYRDHEPMRLSV